MSVLSDLLKRIFGGKKPVKPVDPAKLVELPRHNVSIWLNPAIVGATITARYYSDKVPTVVKTQISNADGWAWFEDVPNVPLTFQLRVDVDGFEAYSYEVQLPIDTDFHLGENGVPTLVRTKAPTRKGIVRGNGRQFVDDDGEFWPLGYTLFWAYRGWKSERDRIKANIDYIGKMGADYIRILGQVGWSGLEIRPEDADYVQLLGELIDYAYDVAGIRVQITMIGGGTFDVDLLTNKTIAVVRGREHKVFAIEVANESFQNFEDESKMIAIGQKLRRELPQTLIALSTPVHEETSTQEWLNKGAVNFGLNHFDRSDPLPEWKWRHVRKPWEARNPSVPSSSNEPGGPRSSVAQYEESIHLTMCRIVGILCGWYAYVFHNGAGIFGVSQDKYGGRTPNVWEIPGIDDMFTSLRKLDAFVPKRAGTMTRTGLGGHPLTFDAFVLDNGRGVVRDYASVWDDGFWQTLLGITQFVNLKSNGNYALDFINPLTGTVVRQAHVKAGESIRVPENDAEPMARDSRGMGAYIVVGRRE